MKKFIAVMLLASIATGVFAQKGYHFSRPRVIISGGFAPYYAPFYSPFYPYYGFGYSNPYNRYSQRPTKLDLKIEDIENEYKDKIWAVRHDDKLTRKERRNQVHWLKREKDQEILEARKNYYHPQ